MKPVKVSRKLAAAEEAARALAKAAGHHPAAWHEFSPVRAFAACVMAGCNMAFSLDLTGSFGHDEGPLPTCPYVAPTRRTWQFGALSAFEASQEPKA